MGTQEPNLLTAKYCYNVLTLKKNDGNIERLGNTLFNSKIKLTPHQIQAALFAFKSPISKGVILADEVGLGKTIEAGIVISQTWYEKHGKILIVSPASLMRQWQNEMVDKFDLESTIIDRKSFNTILKNGFRNPFNSNLTPIYICSYQMCSSLKDYVSDSEFNLVVIDEAHKLRNSHNEKNVTATNIKTATQKFKKILLTATPIQNNLLDLFGVSSVIDENIFGNKDIFRYKYLKNFGEYESDLENRLKRVLHRTLRKQVRQYIQFTNRIPKTFSFKLTEKEKDVYERIRTLINNSDDDSYLMPKSQKHLLLLILCKLMGSSMHSIVFTLEKMKSRLEKIKETGINDFSNDYSDIDVDELDDEICEEEKVEKINYKKLDEEIANISIIIKEAASVDSESKYQALKDSLEFSFKHLRDLKAEEKVLIFTESRRTQEYLKNSLKNDGYDKVIIFNGSNNDEESNEIYNRWINNPQNQGKIQLSKSVNMRNAILDEFENDGKILIATEAGAEGLNLQFCSLVINYDLPWNPQRVEQRIGRCHRFGQKHDVVVINFISSDNVVEQRIYELLDTKFRLFNDILGSSDSVIGTIEDGKDIENAIVEIYKKCRTTAEINAAFDELQEKYKEDIETSVSKAKEELLKNFEEDVQRYFSDLMASTEEMLSEREKLLSKILKCLYKDDIKFFDDFSFEYNAQRYKLSTKNESKEYIDFNLNTNFGKEVLNRCKSICRNNGTIYFDISNYKYKISRVENLKGKKGYISFSKLEIDSFGKEEFLVANGILDDGKRIDPELCNILFRLDTYEDTSMESDEKLIKLLDDDQKVNISSLINECQIKNNQYLKDEIDKINKWTDDKILSVQLEVENMRAERKELQLESDCATNLKEKEEIEKRIVEITKKIKKQWNDLADAEEELEDQRKNMISAIKKENMKKYDVQNLFTARFEVI